MMTLHPLPQAWRCALLIAAIGVGYAGLHQAIAADPLTNRPGMPSAVTRTPTLSLKERAPAKATISLNCEKVITLSTGSGRGTCSINPADGSGRCDDGDGNAAAATCQSCRRTTGAGSCLIH